jgi:hypothetical protein
MEETPNVQLSILKIEKVGSLSVFIRVIRG